MYHFCTLFDKNYLFQGMALYRSLERHSGDFKLYVLCMDQVAYDMINKINQPDLVPIHLSELEDDETRIVRQRTTHGQFCWVCQPLVCSYILDHFKVDMITYLEADSMFFADPAVLFEELDGFSVSLVPHRYTPKYDQSKLSGKYCVQFNAFKNDPDSREVLQYWRNCCFKYTKDKPLYVPGQITLDEWPERFACVKEIEHLGAGVAPWNVQQYLLAKTDEGLKVNNVPLIFYHYHQYGRYDDGSHELGYYSLARTVIDEIYVPYVKSLNEVEQWIKSINPAFTYRKEKKKPKNFMGVLHSLSPSDLKEYLGTVYRKIRGNYNIYADDYFNKT